MEKESSKKEKDLPEEIEVFIRALMKKGNPKDLFDMPEYNILSKENKTLLLTLLEDFLIKRNSETATKFSEVENRLQMFSKSCFELVPDMLKVNEVDFAIFLACISGILSDIWNNKINMASVASEMHQLMIMHVSENNKSAQLASNLFNDFQAIKK